MRAASASQIVAPTFWVLTAKAATRAKAAAAIRVSRARSLAEEEAALAAEASPEAVEGEEAKGVVDLFAVAADDKPEAPALAPFAAAFLEPARCIEILRERAEVAVGEEQACIEREKSPWLGEKTQVLMQRKSDDQSAKFFVVKTSSKRERRIAAGS